MKKVLALALTFCAVNVAMACGSNDPELDGTTGATELTGGNGDGSAKGKMLVIYFSRAGYNWQVSDNGQLTDNVGWVERGNTAIMVDYIKELADVDVFELIPEVAYPENYRECTEYVTDEINRNNRPRYKNDITNLDDYETIFVGGPIWWARPPMLFRTFFENHPELDGKVIIPFGTHGGSGVSSYTSLVNEYYPNANVLESLGISGSSIRNASSKTTVENWLKKLGVDKQSTAIISVRTRTVNNGISYSLNGMRSNNKQGLFDGGVIASIRTGMFKLQG